MYFFRITALIIFLDIFLFPAFAGQSAPPLSINTVVRYLNSWLAKEEKHEKIRVGGATIIATPLVQQFYMAREFQPAWSNENGPIPQADQLIRALENIFQEGLHPEDYHLKKIKKLISGIRQGKYQRSGLLHPVRVAALDLLLTDAFFLCATHLTSGRINPQLIDERIAVVEQNHDFSKELENVLKTGCFSEKFQSMAPASAEYACLRKALADYRIIEKKTVHLHIAYDPPLKKGDRDKQRIPALRVKLGAFGDLAKTSTVDDTLFNDEVESAIRHFQTRLGLKVTGELDKATVTCLNTPIASYIQRLEINMERLRWRRYKWEQRYILVNIPAFSLEFIQNRKTVLSMRVVVGQKYSRTPIFSDKLRFIVLNPRWEIPPNILLRKKLYRIRHEPDYFEKHNIQVIKGWGKEAKEIDPKMVDWQKVRIREFYKVYRFRQASGPANPLGRIKFMFPNKYNIYLHDTPDRQLFNKELRHFSSGCIRVEKPVELAAYCLRGQRLWTRSRIEAALAAGIEQKIKLTNPISIHILYWTAWVDQYGLVHFRRDIYGRDKKIMQQFCEAFFPSF